MKASNPYLTHLSSVTTMSPLMPNHHRFGFTNKIGSQIIVTLELVAVIYLEWQPRRKFAG